MFCNRMFAACDSGRLECTYARKKSIWIKILKTSQNLEDLDQVSTLESLPGPLLMTNHLR